MAYAWYNSSTTNTIRTTITGGPNYYYTDLGKLQKAASKTWVPKYNLIRRINRYTEEGCYCAYPYARERQANQGLMKTLDADFDTWCKDIYDEIFKE